MAAKLTLGTRPSPLARHQAETARAALCAADAELAPEAVEIVPVRTTGDRRRDRPLAEIGGKQLFTKELDEALLDGTIDVAVHSLKDVPTILPEGHVLAAFLARASPLDALIARTACSLAELPEGARIGTSSVRRSAQLRHARPDLVVEPLRGNLETRLAKVDRGRFDATLLAQAGLARMEKTERATVVPPDELLPAAGQGTIGLQCRADDAALVERLAGITHRVTELAVRCERQMLAALGGTCETPIGALARVNAVSGQVRLDGAVVRPDGSALYRRQDSSRAADSQAMGYALGEALRAACDPTEF